MPRSSPEIPSRFQFIIDWWHDATGRNAEWHLDMSPGRRILRRILLWVPAVVLVALITGIAGLYFYTGWRARDLARKARLSLQGGDAGYALIQAESARQLRGRNPEVLRAYAAALAANGDPRSLEVWEQLAQHGPLSEEDRAEQAVAALRLGDETKFDPAMAVLEQAGRGGEALVLRAERAMAQRKSNVAEKFFRRALERDPSPDLQLRFASLLSSIGTEEALAEAVEIVGGLAEQPGGDKALAFGLATLPVPADTRAAWATRAFQDLRPDNAALLPAATLMVDASLGTVDDIVRQLQPVFAEATPEQRAAYARWLLDHKRPGEALLFARATEARTSRETFSVRADALVATGDYGGLLKLIQSGSPLSENATLLLRAQAERGLARAPTEDSSLRRTLATAARKSKLPEALEEADAAGRQELADQILLELCYEQATADYALRVARRRFAERDEPRLRTAAFANASQAMPRAPAVLDMQRLERLLAGGQLDPGVTQKALEAEPANPDVRLTHAFALLRASRGPEAREVIEPFMEKRQQLTPPQRVIVAAVLEATGSHAEAVELARTLTPAQLTGAEFRLIQPMMEPGAE